MIRLFNTMLMDDGSPFRLDDISLKNQLAIIDLMKIAYNEAKKVNFEDWFKIKIKLLETEIVEDK